MQFSKTGLFGLLLVVLGAVQSFDFATIIPAQYSGIATSLIGAVVVLLRAMTTTPAAAGLIKKPDQQ